MASAFRAARYRQPKHEVAPEHLPAAVAVHTFNKPPAHPGLDLPVKAPGGRHLTSFPVHQLAPRIPFAELPEVLRGETSLGRHP